MKHNPNKCANCGADQRPGSTLCNDCIIACGGRHNDYIIEENYLMEMFKDGVKCAEIDLTGWTVRKIEKVIYGNVHLLGRTVKINRNYTPVFDGPDKESASPPASGKGKIS